MDTTASDDRNPAIIIVIARHRTTVGADEAVFSNTGEPIGGADDAA